MHSRYVDTVIGTIFASKYDLWQDTELAALAARTSLGCSITYTDFGKMEKALRGKRIDAKLIAEIEEKIRHDLNAFIEERRTCLPFELSHHLHKGLTSYDTEEPAFTRMLKMACERIEGLLVDLLPILSAEVKKYRYTIMLARTHGQEAKLQTHGKRLLTWYVQLESGLNALRKSMEILAYSKMSGAIGCYGDFTPEMEEKALLILGLKPFYGATQIMPRELYLPIASALTGIVGTIDKISVDIRLGSRSGNAIYQEPFKKDQMGSSAMPHKKNTISTEQMEGMFRLAKGYLLAITDNIVTWEERAIEQSSVERVAWEDLFHVTAHSIRRITKVISGMKVFPDRMYKEIINSQGCYASDEAKNFLGEKVAEQRLSAEDAYRIVQLAAENAHNPGEDILEIREIQPESIEKATFLLERTEKTRVLGKSIRDIIQLGALEHSPDLKADEDQVKIWNHVLKAIFGDREVCIDWRNIFEPLHLLRGEKILFERVFGDKHRQPKLFK